ncbi:LysR family transcriptional regulator [Enterobacter cloacae]|uniref:LysR family transcriptional regulator n=1 Tax=Enterobacter cloacae TaxID=550 RepID=UPI002003D0E9|nr:LysR family transcriptional regulator [Enterobacter cloacae]MCK7415833.1 LysR family transcriptional regulator [Enterobacter cloacae]MCK7438235.1 LysR family transcriptional regulator [Enterobacter cloacae]
MMNLLHWRLVVAVADASNISRAAEEVGMTQSGASQAIAQLEAALGFAVFTRERRHIGVTALGEQVVKEARSMLARLDAIRVLADESRGLSGGRIRLASFPSVTSTFLPGLLRDFKRLHPEIEVVVLEGTDQEVEEWIAADTVDLGVVMNPVPGRADAILGQDAWVAVLPASHRQARDARARGITLEELADQPFVLATGGCAVNGKSLMEQAGLRLSDVRVTVRDWISACLLVREGMGVALIPESALPGELRGLCIVPVTPSLCREFGVVCSQGGKSSRATQTLFEGLSKMKRSA